MRHRFLILFPSLVAMVCVSALAATYSGNGNSGFGGPIGLGSLTLTDNGTTGSLAPSTRDRTASTTFWCSTSIVFRVAFLTRLDLATAQMVCAGPSPGLTAAAIAVVVGQRGSGMRSLGFSGGSLSRL